MTAEIKYFYAAVLCLQHTHMKAREGEQNPMAADSKDTKNRVKELTDKIEQGVKELFASERYMEYLRTMARFSSYSTRNTLLIHLQKPDATRVAGFRTWETTFGRHVNKGEHGIKILAPTPFTVKEERQKLDPVTKLPVLGLDGLPELEEVERHFARFKVIHVFDVSQTNGKPLPTLVDEISGDVANYELFMDALRAVSPLPIGFEAMPNADGYCVPGERIAIREGMSQVQTVAAVIHEITHARLHDIEALRLQDENAKRKDKRTEEVEAESVAYAVSQYYGIETGGNSLGYIATWSSGRDLKEYTASLETIRKTTDEMINAINGKYRELAKQRGIDLNVGDKQEQSDTPERDASATQTILESESGQKYSEKLFNYSVIAVTSRVLLDREYLNARDETDVNIAANECSTAVERAVMSLFPKEIELFAFYKGDAGFRERLEGAVYNNTYTDYHKQLAELSAANEKAAQEEKDPPPRQASAEEHGNYKKFADMFPQIVSGEYNYIRFESNGYEPLSIQRIGGDTISIMHTYTMNGDLMYDPDITFKIDNDAKTLSALTFEQSLPPLYQEVTEADGRGQSIDGNGNQREVLNLQHKIDVFFSTWLNNIHSQEFIPVCGIRVINGEDFEVTFNSDGKPIMPEQENESGNELVMQETPQNGDSFEKQRVIVDKEGNNHTVYYNDNNKPFEIGMGHMGNGLTVWNRLEEKDGDYVTVAHISPDRVVNFYEKDLPEAVKLLIEHEARSSDMTISATQPGRVFHTPPTYPLEYHDIPVYGLEVYNGLKELVADICPNGAVSYHNTNLPQMAIDEITARAKEISERREAEFLNGADGTYGIYTFEALTGDSRIVRENYRLAYFGELGEGATLDTIRDQFISENYPYEYYPRSSGVPFGPGDIIVLKQDGLIKPWYVDTLSFSEQTEFFGSAIAPQHDEKPEHDNSLTSLNMRLPDPLVSTADRDNYGYTAPDMLPLLNARAAELFDSDHVVYLLYPDNSEAMAFDRDEIMEHDGLCGIERGDWERSPVLAAQLALAANAEAVRESDLLHGTEHTGMFGIYQLKDGEKLRYHRFAHMKELESSGLSVDRANYELVYTAPLAIQDTLTNLNKIYQDFNTGRPDGFTGHSVSVSDVIVTQWRGDVSAHYVDGTGFKPLNVFTGNEKQPEPMTDVKTYSQVGNTFEPPAQNAPAHTGPSVAELEAEVKAGKTISLSDLASAVKAERRQDRPNKRPSLLGRLEEKKGYMAAQAQNSGATAQTTNKEASHE